MKKKKLNILVMSVLGLFLLYIISPIDLLPFLELDDVPIILMSMGLLYYLGYKPKNIFGWIILAMVAVYVISPIDLLPMIEFDDVIVGLGGLTSQYLLSKKVRT